MAETRPVEHHTQLGNTLPEEIAACILGGFGMPWRRVAPFYQRVLRSGLLEKKLDSPESIIELLSAPIVDQGRSIRYRFPQQRGVRLFGALQRINGVNFGAMGDYEMREWLLQAPGVGWKTASWIVRNRRQSDAVAIIDVHLVRAGLRAGVFAANWTLSHDYRLFEEAFLTWSRSVGLRPSHLDATIWGCLSDDRANAIDILWGAVHPNQSPKPVWPVSAHDVGPTSRERVGVS